MKVPMPTSQSSTAEASRSCTTLPSVAEMPPPKFFALHVTTLDSYSEPTGGRARSRPRGQGSLA
eukprot:4563355-Prymnesium_polylepis.1